MIMTTYLYFPLFVDTIEHVYADNPRSVVAVVPWLSNVLWSCGRRLSGKRWRGQCHHQFQRFWRRFFLHSAQYQGQQLLQCLWYWPLAPHEGSPSQVSRA